SHLLVDAVLSMKSLEGSNNFWATFDNWGWGEFYTYVELNDDTQFSSTDSKQFLDKHIGEENRKRAGLELIAQPIASIHTTTGILNEISPTRDQRILDFLQLIAAIIVFLAAINYVNLSTAKGIKRAKEVGIRKNLGATRGALTAQFALESMALNLLALAFAVTIIQIIQPWLINGIGEAFESSVFASDSSVYLSLIPIAIALLWSTFQPALVISNFSVIKVMKGKVSDNGNGKFYRNVSVGIQFAVSLILMITTYVIYEQIRYFQNYNLGINIDQKIIVNKPKEQVDNYLEKAITFRNSLESLAAVQNVSASGSVPAHGFNWATNSMRRVDKPAERVGEYGINVTYIDEEYVEIYQPEVLLGSTSINDFSNEKKAVINESALNPLEIESLEQAIGMKVTNDGKDEFEIIGVIKNYQHTSLLMESRPAIFIFENNPQYFTIQYNLGNQGLARTNQLITDINKLYNAAFGSVNFEYAFLDEKFAEEYRYESFLANIIISFTGVSILLAGMGLFGLSFFNMERKTKEVGIRKTLGASTVSLFKVNFTPIFKLFIMASIFAIPLAMLISTKWLEDYTNKIDLNIIYFIIPAGILLVVMLFTVSYHLLKLNNVNPVESLRYE
ncbi:MAG: FtsX-like permease family protein, partial [Fulvivirga sp.]|uniref:FtsX-like permease family protein n=1 Tax=Fulvivirga sp. TaxID=1931237 RepID=UPI0032ECDEB3